MNAFGQAFQEILATLDRFEIPFFVGGSVASSNYGLPRQTNDCDIIADIHPTIVPDLCRELFFPVGENPFTRSNFHADAILPLRFQASKTLSSQ